MEALRTLLVKLLRLYDQKVRYICLIVSTDFSKATVLSVLSMLMLSSPASVLWYWCFRQWRRFREYHPILFFYSRCPASRARSDGGWSRAPRNKARCRITAWPSSRRIAPQRRRIWAARSCIEWTYGSVTTILCHWTNMNSLTLSLLRRLILLETKYIWRCFSILVTSMYSKRQSCR